MATTLTLRNYAIFRHAWRSKEPFPLGILGPCVLLLYIIDIFKFISRDKPFLPASEILIVCSPVTGMFNSTLARNNGDEVLRQIEFQLVYEVLR